MRRREFVGLIGTAALRFSQPGYAQNNTSLPLVGFLTPASSEIGKVRVAALRLGLQEEGLIEGTDYSLALRYAGGEMDRVPLLAAELAALKPRVIVGAGNAARVFRELFPEIPLVFTGVAIDPVAAGLAESYVRPGGMATGNVMNAIGNEVALTEKRIGYFMELVPGLKRLGVVGWTGWNGVSNHVEELTALRKVSGHFGFELKNYLIQTTDDLEGAFGSGRNDGVDAFYISGDPLLLNNIPRVMPFVWASGKPSVGTTPEWGRAGLLMSYATDLTDGFRQAGTYVAKILKGAKPGDLPIQQASKFALVINQKTAKALGITVPPTLLALADEVIE